MKYFLSGLLGFIICFAILVGFEAYNGEPRLIIQTNIQYETTTKYIKVPYTSSKTNIYTNYITVYNELNDYLTVDGWICQSNNQIYAGIKDRVWSAPYTIIQPTYKHSIGVMLGDGIVIDYGYQIFKRLKVRGGLWSKNDKTSLLLGSSFQF